MGAQESKQCHFFTAANAVIFNILQLSVSNLKDWRNLQLVNKEFRRTARNKRMLTLLTFETDIGNLMAMGMDIHRVRWAPSGDEPQPCYLSLPCTRLFALTVDSDTTHVKCTIALLFRHSLTLKHLWFRDIITSLSTLQAIGRCKELETLDLSCSCGNLTDVHARYIAQELRKLQVLKLSWFEDLTCLEGIATLPDLHTLDLGHCRITNKGFQHIVGLRKLKQLVLDSCAVTDAWLDLISRNLHKLEVLIVTGANVTSEAVHQLEARLPKLSVTWGSFFEPTTTRM